MFSGAFAVIGINLLRHLLPIGQELLDSRVGQRVLGQLDHDRVGDSRDVRTDQGAVEDMDRVAHAGDDDFGVVAVIVEDGAKRLEGRCFLSC